MLRALLIVAAVVLVVGVLYLAYEAATPPYAVAAPIRPNAGAAPAAAPWQRFLGALGIGAATYAGGRRGAVAAEQLGESIGWVQG